MSAKNGSAAGLAKFEFPKDVEFEEQTASVDWLTITAREEQYINLLVLEAQRTMRDLKAKGYAQKPWNFRGYVGWTCGGMRYGSRDDGVCVMLSGQTADLNWPVVLSWANNVTRLDLACTLTLRDPYPNLATLWYGVITLGNTSRAKLPRKYTLITNSLGGETLYIGSRASDQYGRLYDKGREENANLDVPDGKIWRYEVEFKQYRANKIAGYLLEEAKREESPVRDQISATVHKWFLSRGIQPIWNSDNDLAWAMDISAKLSDDATTLHWFSTQVAPSVRRLMAKGKGQEVLQSLGL